MVRWRITLFGTPQVSQDGETIRIGRRKATALLAYLTMTGKPQARETLLTLLWPDFDRASAQNNLRRELALLRKSIGDELLQSDRKDIWLAESAALLTDYNQFNTLVDRPHSHNGSLSAGDLSALEKAVSLAADELLASFSLPDAPEFNDWLFFERAETQQKLLTALNLLTSHYWAGRDFDPAIQYAKRKLSLDPLTEQNHRDLMRLFASANQTTAALRQYEQCVDLLQTELGIEPEEETVALFESIRTRRLRAEEPPRPILKVKSSTKRTAHLLDLPKLFGPFVGREDDLSSIQNLLTTEPDCRLLTLIGPGGIGKTSLAIELAPQLVDAYPDGLVYVPLADERNPAGLPSRIM
ncbi:MAG: BTAD domain-containing putative transcriptional regulator, partial [Chloroflexota bacterium]